MSWRQIFQLVMSGSNPTPPCEAPLRRECPQESVPTIGSFERMQAATSQARVPGFPGASERDSVHFFGGASRPWSSKTAEQVKHSVFRRLLWKDLPSVHPTCHVFKQSKTTRGCLFFSEGSRMKHSLESQTASNKKMFQCGH